MGLMGEAWGVWMRVLAHMLLDEVERNTFYQLPDKGPRREEWLMGRVAAKEAAWLWIQREYQIELANADIRIDNDAHGRPRVQCAALEGRVAPSISISHSGATAVAVAGDANNL